MRASTKWGSCCSIPITILLLNLWAGIYPSCFVQQHTLLTPILAGGTWGGTWGSGGGDGFRLRPKHRIKSPDPFCVYSFSTEILILETCNLDHITQESFSIHSSPTWGSFSKPIPMSELKKVGCWAAKKSVPLGHLEWLPLLSVHCQTKGWCLHFLPFPNPPPCQSSTLVGSRDGFRSPKAYCSLFSVFILLCSAWHHRSPFPLWNCWLVLH